MTKIVTIDRYPGLRPFEESERFMFFGRSMELEELAQAININDLFVLHGESGLGKSSLINAGLIPVLREKGFYPVLIRFKERNKAPLQQVLHELKKLLKDIGNGQTLQDENKLWVWVKLMNSTGLKPILIFDQFEEFSYFNAEDRLVLVKELAALLSPRIPDYARDITPGPEADPAFSWFTQPKVKLLFSLRSDRISILEDFSELMPAMLRSRYQLKPILLEQVEQIVVMPAVMESFNSIHFASQPFQYQPALISDVIEVVKDKKRNTVETTQLQMICQEIELMVKERQKTGEENICVTQADLPKEKLEDFVNDFYRKQLEKIHNNPEISPEEFIAIRVLIEKRLLVQKKRIPLAEGTVFQHFYDFFKEKNITIGDDKIRLCRDLLLSLRLIRDQTYGDSLFYELSHDTLIEPINTEMTERETEERRKLIAEERRKQDLEILKQRKYIDEINKQKERAENALKELEVSANEQKKLTKVAQDTLAELKTVKAKEEKIRRRLSRLIGIIIFVAFGLIISYVVFLDSRNKKSNNLLARVYRNEGRNNYELGNHQLAYRFWKDALVKSSNENLNNELREELKRDFAAFSGMTTYVAPDGKATAIRLRDSTWNFWELGDKHAKLRKVFRHREKITFFNNGRWYYLVDSGHVKVYNFADSAYRPFKNAHIDLDKDSASKATGFGEFFLVRTEKKGAVVFSFRRGGNLVRINGFLRKIHDSATAMNAPYYFPLADSTFVLCSFNKHSYYLDLYRDTWYPLPVYVDNALFMRFENFLAIWPGNTLHLLNLQTRQVRPVLPRFNDERQEIAGVADNGKYILITDQPEEYGRNKRLYGVDLERGDRFDVVDNYATVNIFYKSPDVVLFMNNSLYLFNCKDRTLKKVVDTVHGLSYYQSDKVMYYRGSEWTMADRATMATDTVFGDLNIKNFEWPFVCLEKGSTAAVYDCAQKRTVASYNLPEGQKLYSVMSGRFANFRSTQTTRGSSFLNLYLKFIDSSLRSNEDLQRYFKPYLDDAMEINK